MIQGYVDSLRYGTAQLGDPGGNDRTKSLTASLNYGLENAFDAHAMKVLSLLSLFRTYVNSFTVWIMCHPITDRSASGMPDHDFSWNIRDLEDETHKSVERVLEKAADLGVLRKTEDCNFWLHPAIHLHFQPFFDRSYAGTEQGQIAQRAYAEAEGMFSIQFTRYLQVGAVIELWVRSRKRKPTYIRRCISVALMGGGKQKLEFSTASMRCCCIKEDMKNGEWCFHRFWRISLART